MPDSESTWPKSPDQDTRLGPGPTGPPPLGRPADNRILGLPERLAPDWQAGFLRAFGDRLDHYRWLKLFMDICVRCGACAGKCPVFIGTGDPMNTPAARIELARKVYQKCFTAGGRLAWRLGITGDPDEKTLYEWYIYFNQCLT
ncbi:MAG: (Fe-S)-binding protein, partial [Pseudomonadota bacterium]